MFLSPFKTIFYQLYLLQLENYSLRRFIRVSLRSIGKRRVSPRKSVVWTLKLTLLFALALALQIFAAFLIGQAIVPHREGAGGVAFFAGLLLLCAFSYVYFLFLALSVALVLPFDFFVKRRIIAQARKKVAARKNLIVVGITGSYGKTTMKETLAAILSGKYRVLKTPESVNTPIGIARLILEKLNEDVRVFIVEMGAYHRGDIKTLCAIAPPDFSVLAGINESHLERFSSIENTIATKFEIVENMKKRGVVVLNADDERIREAYARYVGKHETLFYSAKDNPLSSCRVLRTEFFEDGTGATFSLVSGTTQYDFKTALLGEYIVGTTAAGVLIGERLGMRRPALEAGVALLKPVPHRLEAHRVPGDILIIDDSYNGNPEGVREAITVLARFTGHRKIYITPGLVEMGKRTQEIHRDIGKELGAVADLVVLIENSVTSFIREGLEKAGFAKESIKVFPSAKEAHGALLDLLTSGDVVLFQNDWPEGYV